MAVNQQRKRAMKRLMTDLEELRTSPVANISATPLDSNMFEWHCNFCYDDIIYHLILFIPEEYPYVSPSAEFVPRGFQYGSGATLPGKKGTKVCLSIFSDFATYHTEWKNEKAMGWCPGYSIQTVLLNLLSFLAETQSGQGNRKLAENFSCKDCGHTFKKPYPSLDMVTRTDTPKDEPEVQIICYISKEKFKAQKPKSADELFAYGLIKSGPPHRPSLTTPCEFLTVESFNSMKKYAGKVQSVMKEELSFLLPIYIHPLHGAEIKSEFEENLKKVNAILVKSDSKKSSIEEMVIRIIPNLMCATVVEFSKGTQHTSDNHLNGYFALHRLMLWALDTYPGLINIIEAKLKDFIENESKRSKKECPHIGEWLMLLSSSEKYSWQDAARAYLSESWRRNVMWFVKDEVKLGMLNTDKQYRLRETFKRTEVSRKILAFQVLFLDIALPKGKSRKNLTKRYDSNLGFPTSEMVTSMKEAVDKINNMNSYSDWFKVLKMEVIPDDELFSLLIDSLKFSIRTDGYHWSLPKNAGGWKAVLEKYRPKGVVSFPDDSSDTGGASSSKGKGRGKKSASASEDPHETKPKTSGRGKKATLDDVMDTDDKPVGRGRGRGKRSAAEAEVGGKGRGGKRRK